MFDGVMLLWWILTIPSFLFVVIDVWRTTPESPVLKWAFVILTAFAGPLGAFFYVLGCREPLRGNHEQYVTARWRQVLGSTMHCVAGDDPMRPQFWFLMSMALIVGFGCAYPINWWLVANHMKHGMMRFARSLLRGRPRGTRWMRCRMKCQRDRAPDNISPALA